MASLAFIMPVLPGKADDFRRFAQEVTGPRRKEMDEQGQRFGLTSQRVWIQRTPQGDVLIVFLEGDAPGQSLQGFGASQEPFDRWFKQEILAITGVDFNQPPPELPELVLNWQAPG